ncbi:IclR family transcriptional regulator [Streptomyces sp. MMCC 100]|uniref:IclR family transcriptional regulator n=1 Tax=Streptomyces sp. MMCC 100 TaxID=3163555 RepID=UPI003595B46F
MPANGETMIERVIRILEVFDDEQSLTASEIARRTGIPVPSAHRIVTDLIRSGLLERDGRNGIRMGLRLWELATRASGALTLRDVALPYMEDLHAAVQQHTQLSVLDRNDVLYVEKLTSPRSSSTNITQPGSRLPVLACAAGLVLTAFSSRQNRESILTTAKLTRFTESTVVDRGRLRELVADVRQTGFAVARAWIHPGTSGTAVPILGRDGTAMAALSVTTPLPTDERLTLVPALRTAARAIARAADTDVRAADPRLNVLKQKVRRATAAS